MPNVQSLHSDHIHKQCIQEVCVHQVEYTPEALHMDSMERQIGPSEQKVCFFLDDHPEHRYLAIRYDDQ